MRAQGKPFTVKKKKSRKPRAAGESRFGLMGVQPRTSETPTESGNLARAERIFRAMGAAPDPLPLQNGGLPATAPASVEPGTNRALEQTPGANRILPDLSRHEPLQGERKDETSMASKPTRSRIR